MYEHWENKTKSEVGSKICIYCRNNLAYWGIVLAANDFDSSKLYCCLIYYATLVSYPLFGAKTIFHKTAQLIEA
jgi:hypothetical protein